jgi:hypothetical protein
MPGQHLLHRRHCRRRRPHNPAVRAMEPCYGPPPVAVLHLAPDVCPRGSPIFSRRTRRDPAPDEPSYCGQLEQWAKVTGHHHLPDQIFAEDRVVFETTRWYLKQKTVCGFSPVGHGRYADVELAGGCAKRALKRGRKSARYAFAPSRSRMPARRSSLRRRSWKVPKSRSMRPLACGPVGGDPVDAQFLQGAFDLGRRGFPGELLGEGERALRRAVKDAMAIAVGSDGDPLGLGEGVKDVEIPMRIFLVPKGGGRDFPRGVINHRQEGEARTALLQPIVVAAIELHEEAFLRHALPAVAVAVAG